MVEISQIISEQKRFFDSGKTRDYAFRINCLKKLKTAVLANERLICSALQADLNKPETESYMCEIGIVYDEISFHIKHLKKWMKNKRVKTPIAQFKSRSFISPEPYGVALIMSPWNYPVQLCLSPLIGAISAGNCAIIKPSSYSPNVSEVIEKIISQAFSREYVAVVTGGREENELLLNEKFDFIFFTGSVAVGKYVMKKASENLVPLCLELGGKSPVIVEKSANLEISARRICFGKMLNAGQTCVAPDYVLCQKSVKDKFVEYYKKAVLEFFKGEFSDFPKIINQKHFLRLKNLLVGEKIIFGGELNENTRFISPTLVEIENLNSPLMQEEIFGPILPIITFENLDECIELINFKPKPLALYLFTTDKQTEKRVLNGCSFGGGCINDTIIHLATPHMGFGGVGQSGMGSYHGEQSFKTFSHFRSIVKKSFSFDLKMRYRPYTEKKEKIIKKFLK